MDTSGGKLMQVDASEDKWMQVKVRGCKYWSLDASEGKWGE